MNYYTSATTTIFFLACFPAICLGRSALHNIKYVDWGGEEQGGVGGGDAPLMCPPGLCAPLIDALDLDASRVQQSDLDGIVEARVAFGLDADGGDGGGSD